MRAMWQGPSFTFVPRSVCVDPQALLLHHQVLLQRQHQVAAEAASNLAPAAAGSQLCGVSAPERSSHANGQPIVSWALSSQPNHLSMLGMYGTPGAGALSPTVQPGPGSGVVVSAQAPASSGFKPVWDEDTLEDQELDELARQFADEDVDWVLGEDLVSPVNAARNVEAACNGADDAKLRLGSLKEDPSPPLTLSPAPVGPTPGPSQAPPVVPSPPPPAVLMPRGTGRSASRDATRVTPDATGGKRRRRAPGWQRRRLRPLSYRASPVKQGGAPGAKVSAEAGEEQEDDTDPQQSTPVRASKRQRTTLNPTSGIRAPATQQPSPKHSPRAYSEPVALETCSFKTACDMWTTNGGQLLAIRSDGGDGVTTVPLNQAMMDAIVTCATLKEFNANLRVLFMTKVSGGYDTWLSRKFHNGSQAFTLHLLSFVFCLQHRLNTQSQTLTLWTKGLAAKHKCPNSKVVQLMAAILTSVLPKDKLTGRGFPERRDKRTWQQCMADFGNSSTARADFVMGTIASHMPAGQVLVLPSCVVAAFRDTATATECLRLECRHGNPVGWRVYKSSCGPRNARCPKGKASAPKKKKKSQSSRRKPVGGRS